MHVSGFKYREIAEKLGLPLGTVKSTSSWKANARGVDLNRNYKYNYHAKYGGRRGGSGYSGPYAESEPETKAVVKLINTLKNNTKLKGTVNYHAMGSIAFGSVRRGIKKRIFIIQVNSFY